MPIGRILGFIFNSEYRGTGRFFLKFEIFKMNPLDLINNFKIKVFQNSNPFWITLTMKFKSLNFNACGIPQGTTVLLFFSCF